MTQVLEKIQELPLDERANLAIAIQKSFANNEQDFTGEQKADLDARLEQHIESTDKSVDLKEFLSAMLKRYARA